MPTYIVTETVIRSLRVEADSVDEACQRFYDANDDEISEKSGDVEVEELE